MKDLALISEFDPWHSRLCTCPPKLTFNPYTGCDHACVYCYASSYIPKFSQCRPKKNLIPRLTRESAKLKGETVSIANSSDPYPRIEAKLALMRKCLEILSTRNCKIQIITKSNIVTRDIDLLKKTRSMVSLTITTENDNMAKIIEPNAPPPSERLKAATFLIRKGVPTSIRIDPVIPYINDNPENLMQQLTSIGVQHVTASTYKIKADSWRRFTTALPTIAEKLKPLYFEKGEKINGYTYLPRETRSNLMKNLGMLAGKYGVKFGTCRETLSHLNTEICDGSWLLSKGASKNSLRKQI